MDSYIDWLESRPGSSHQFTELDFGDQDWSLAAVAEDFARKEIEPGIPAIEAGDHSTLVRLLKRAGEIGLLATDIPTEYGGLGVPNATSLLVAERLAICASFSVSLGVHTGIGSLPVVYYGTDEQRTRHLKEFAAGRQLAAYALTEATAGSDALSLRSQAVSDPSQTSYRVSGAKQFITNAGFADTFVLFARVANSGVTAFLVGRDSPGLSFGSEERKLGLRGTSTRGLSLDEVEVPSDHVLGTVGEGHKIALNMLNIGRLKLGAGSAGIAKRCLRLALEHASQRQQFGRPLSGFGMVRSKLAEMATLIYITDSMGYRTAGMLDEARGRVAFDAPQIEDRRISQSLGQCAVECSILKVFGSETFQFVADEALQILGGYGFMEAGQIERYYRDARAYRIFEGTNEINRLFLFNAVARALARRAPIVAQSERGDVRRNADRELEQILDAVGLAKALVRSALGSLGVEKLDPLGADDQLLVQLAADALIDVYAIDSTVGRMLVLQGTGPAEADELRRSMTVLFLGIALPRLASRAGMIARRMGESGPRTKGHHDDVLHWLEDGQLKRRGSVAELLLAGCNSPIEFAPQSRT